MFSLVKRPLLRRWIYALVAAQIFMSVPMASAFASIASAGQDNHCAEMQHPGGQADQCPCCPEGASGTAACLSACTASLGAVTVFTFTSPPTVHARVAPVLQSHIAQAAEPPLKPPPIY